MPGEDLVPEIEHLAHIRPFFGIAAREEAALEAIDKKVGQSAWLDLEGLDRLLVFSGHGRARNQAVVGAQRDG